MKEEIDKKEAKAIYNLLMEKVVQKNGSLIPSRKEKKTNRRGRAGRDTD